MTQVFFILVYIILWRLAKVSDKHNNKYIMIICSLTLAFISGLRGERVGIDTRFYMNAFNNNFPVPWQFKEVGFKFISRLLMGIFGNAMALFLIYAIVINYLIISRLWDYREKCNFPFMFLLYEMIFFIDTMNITRQFLALALVFYATRYLEKKKYYIFFIFLFSAISIHTTAFFGILFFIVSYWVNSTNKKKRNIAIPFCIFILVGALYVYSKTSFLVYNYVVNGIEKTNVNITFFYRVAAFILAYLMERFHVKIKFNNNLSDTPVTKAGYNYIEFNKHFSIMAFYYTTGLIVSSLGMFFKDLTRTGYYYLIFELLFWGYLTQNSKNKRLNAIIIGIYACYVFSYELLFNGSGIFPYYICLF